MDEGRGGSRSGSALCSSQLSGSSRSRRFGRRRWRRSCRGAKRRQWPTSAIRVWRGALPRSNSARCRRRSISRRSNRRKPHSASVSTGLRRRKNRPAVKRPTPRPGRRSPRSRNGLLRSTGKSRAKGPRPIRWHRVSPGSATARRASVSGWRRSNSRCARKRTPIAAMRRCCWRCCRCARRLSRRGRFRANTRRFRRLPATAPTLPRRQHPWRRRRARELPGARC